MKEQFEQLVQHGHFMDAIAILKNHFPAIYNMDEYLYSNFHHISRGYNMGMIEYSEYSSECRRISNHLNGVAKLIPVEPLSDDDDGRILFVSIRDSGEIYATFNKMPYVPMLISQEEFDKYLPLLREEEVDDYQSSIGIVKIYHEKGKNA